MADEINWIVQGRLQNAGFVDVVNSTQYLFDQNTPGSWRQVVSVTTGGVTITPGVTTPGYAMFVNLDPTNFVQIGGYPGSVLDSVIKLKPGRFAVLPLDPSVTIRAKADTATCLLDVRVWDD